MIIDGKAIAKQIIDDLKQKRRPDKMLAAIFVGNNLQSQSFLRQKELMAKELEIPFQFFHFEDSSFPLNSNATPRAINASNKTTNGK